jgi:hypothetical protein
MMGSIEVVELHEAAEAAIERGAAGEVVAPEHHAPMLGEDRLLQALDEPVRPGISIISRCVTRHRYCRRTFTSLSLITWASPRAVRLPIKAGEVNLE